eukprot:47169-Chlamydomonas_euryale.AAC.1
MPCLVFVSCIECQHTHAPTCMILGYTDVEVAAATISKARHASMTCLRRMRLRSADATLQRAQAALCRKGALLQLSVVHETPPAITQGAGQGCAGTLRCLVSRCA